MKRTARGAAIAMLAAGGLMAATAPAWAATRVVNDREVSCSDGRGHTGKVMFDVYKGVYSGYPNDLHIRSVYHAGAGGGYYRVEHYGWPIDSSGKWWTPKSFGPDDDRSANNLYYGDIAMNGTEGPYAEAYRPWVSGAGKARWYDYQFHFLFRGASSGGFTSSCSVYVRVGGGYGGL